MSITRKITLLVFVPIALLLLANVWTRVEREHDLFESDLKRDQRALVRALVSLAEDLAVREPPERVVALVVEAGAAARMDVAVLDEETLFSREPFAEAERERLRRGKVLTRTEADDGEDEHMTSYAAFALADARLFVVTVSSTFAGRDAYVATTISRFVVTFSLMLVIAFLVAFVVGDRVVGRPVADLLTAMRRVGEGDLTVRLPTERDDELGHIGAEMNRTVEKLALARQALEDETRARLDMVEQLRHAERLATVGQLASGVAHELGTPLHVIASRARRIRTDVHADARVAGEAEIISDEATRMKRIVEQLLAFARRGTPTRADVDVAALADHAGTLLLPMFKKAACRLVVEVDDGADPRAHADPEALMQVFTNLLLNAVQAMPDGGTVTVRISRPTRDQLLVRVVDDGVGMAPDVRARAFEPFFTTKAVGSGTGLGLSVVYGIVSEHGGTISVDEGQARGTSISFTLPAASTPRASGVDDIVASASGALVA